MPDSVHLRLTARALCLQVILNLKPAKLAGHASEAMILAAEIVTEGDPDARQVRLLTPPAGAKPGDRVHLAGGPPATPPPKECKSAPWATIKALLSAQGGKACLDKAPLSCSSGEIAADAPDGAALG